MVGLHPTHTLAIIYDALFRWGIDRADPTVGGVRAPAVPANPFVPPSNPPSASERLSRPPPLAHAFMADDPHELVLYVQSKKAVTTFYRPSPPQSAVGTAPGRAPEEESVSDAPVYFLSDDQARCVALVEETASHRGYHVRVVDVAKVGRLERLVAERLRGVQNFPVLTSSKGARLEGAAAFTEDALAEVMPTELKSVRALAYLKVRGGDLDRIRALLETLPEVKELHFLTGDWDILVVLDFPAGDSHKRRVLDFVTDRIRGIPEVLDTSTVVPEYSVTKFPL
jgi:DNA-binding Lrp family transcriptional regulator